MSGTSEELRGKMLEKLRKLLRLSKSPNEAEAKLALAKALEISERYKIDLADAREEDVRAGVKVEGERIWQGKRLGLGRRYACMVVQAHFRVRCVNLRVYGAVWINAVGTTEDVQVAAYVFDYVSGAMERGWRGWRKARRDLDRLVGPHARESYLEGFYFGLTQALADQKAAMAAEYTDTALVLIRATEEAISEHLAANYPSLKVQQMRDPKERDMQALMDGRKDGLATRIAPALEGGAV